MRETSKAARIVALWDGMRTTKEIADIVGCAPPYVRSVMQRHRGGGMSAGDRNYIGRPEVRFAKSQATRAAHKVASKTGDRRRANKLATQAYRRAKDEGVSTKEANRIYNTVRKKVLYETKNKDLSSEMAQRAYRLGLEGIKIQ